MNLPILTIIIFLPLIGVFFLLFNNKKDNDENRTNQISFNVSFLTSILVFVLSLVLWINFDSSSSEFQFIEEKKWIINFTKYKVGIDGISILFVVLTAFITPICIIATSNSVTQGRRYRRAAALRQAVRQAHRWRHHLPVRSGSGRRRCA